MKSISLYPMEDSNKSITRNPYMGNLVKVLEENEFQIVNKEKYTNFGVINLIYHFLKSDIYYFNWIEDICDRRMGYIQNIFLFILLFFIKISDKKIIWTMHNKVSHNKKNRLLKIFNFYIMNNISDIILTHSYEGIDLSKIFNSKNNIDIKMRHHPLSVFKDKDEVYEKKYDILIWGTISKNKGVTEFLKKNFKKINSLKIKVCIAGKILDPTLEKEILSYKTSHIYIINNFIDNNTLDNLIKESKIILFTYLSDSTLSSGALMYSIERYAYVIGPDIGAFRDLKDEKIINTYRRNEDLVDLIVYILNNKNFLTIVTDYKRRIGEFQKQNSWKNFGIFLTEWIRLKN